MKLNSLLFFVLLLFCGQTYAQQPSKYALLLAVGDYEESTGWAKLGSTNDVEILEEALIANGFDNANITTLTNQEVTNENLKKVFEEKLLNQVKEADILFIHYSGHGQQIVDQNGDEIDGLDECIVPFDSPKNYEAGVYEGEKLIRDDELSVYLNMLRKKMGKEGHILVTMDACHSGTATRGIKTARGTSELMAAKDFKTTKNNDNKGSLIEGGSSENKGEYASLVTISSSTAKQLSYEMEDTDGKNYGLLSFALSKYLYDANEQDTYAEMLTNIRNFVSAETSLQSPQLDGELGMQVLSGGQSKGLLYFETSEWINQNIILLNEGELHGLSEGAKVVLFPVGVMDTVGVKPSFSGSVAYSEAMLSEIELDKPISKEEAMNHWIIVKEKGYANFNIKLKVKAENNKLMDELALEIKNNPNIQLVKEGADLILEKSNGLYSLYNSDFLKITEWEDPTVSEIRDKCLQSAQSNFLKTIEVKDKRFLGEIYLLKNDSHVDDVYLGDEFKIEIKNTGSDDFYFYVLDIQPDNIVNILELSEEARSTEEYHLEPGGTFVSQILVVGEPVGAEVLKLITSPRPINLKNTLVISDTNTRSLNNPLDALLSKQFKKETNTRGVARPGAISISTKVFYIKDKN